MDEYNSIKHDFHKTPNMYPNISNDQQFRLNKINEIKDYFIAEIRERKWAKILVNILLLLSILINH